MRMNRRSFACSLATGVGGLALGGFAGAQAGDLALSLDALARQKGLRFGSTLGSLGRASRFHDVAYRELTARECSVLVAENETKWPQIRPDPSQPYDFSAADEMFDWAKSKNMALRGHTLLWMEAKWLPQWVNQFDFGARPEAAAERLLSEHVATTCGHFGDAIESWDVVNEAINHKTGELHQNVFSRAFGESGSVDQIELAFRLAREHAPKAQLVYNDFMSWGAGSAKHRAAVLKLLAELKRRGAPVQALGVQAHIGIWNGEGGQTQAAAALEWRRFLDEVMALDLDLLITEFDVNDKGLPADLGLRDAGVAAVARDWLDLTLAAPRLYRFLCWGLGDRYSWLQDLEARPDKLAKRPLPYDEQLRPKALRTAIADALIAMSAR